MWCTFKENEHPIWSSQVDAYASTVHYRHADSAVLFIKVNYSYMLDCVEWEKKGKSKLKGKKRLQTE